MITTFFVYIIKILFSIISTYMIIYLICPEDSESKTSLYRQFSLMSLVGSSFLGLFYILSINSENWFLFIFAVILLYIFLNKELIEKEFRMLYFLNLFSIISVVCGYVLYSAVTIVLYYYLNNNINILGNNHNLEEYSNENDKDD